MTDRSATLLPSGMYDMLPPQAAFEASLVNRAVSVFERYGYARVKPPLVEFEESLLTRSDPDIDRHTFRMMDPLSQKMMGLRADLTMQVVRIAATCLSRAPRPLRLCYAAETVRTRGEALRARRQVLQAGIEMIGVDTAEADAEVIIVAAEALMALDVPGLSIDLNLPTLIPAVLEESGLSHAEQDTLADALARKDASAVPESYTDRETLEQLIAAMGPAEKVITRLQALSLPEKAARQCERLAEVVVLLRQAFPDVRLTIDVTENRGFAYHRGLSFTLFSSGVEAEVGRGGRYIPAFEAEKTSATGFTLFMDRLARHLPCPEAATRVYVPIGTAQDTIQALHADGLITIRGLQPVDDVQAEARRLQCQQIWQDGSLIPVQN